MSFKTEEEFIHEMALAGYGDWTPTKDMIARLGGIVAKKNWMEIGTIEINTVTGAENEIINLSVRTAIDGERLLIIVGEFKKYDNDTNSSFNIVCGASLLRNKRLENIITLADIAKKRGIYNVDGIKVKDTYQSRGIALKLYKMLVEDGYVILGDEVQYFGARRLWTKLSKRFDVVISIININTGDILEKDVDLTHGFEDYEFDDRVWSYTDEKKDIRLLLEKVEEKK